MPCPMYLIRRSLLRICMAQDRVMIQTNNDSLIRVSEHYRGRNMFFCVIPHLYAL